MWENESKNRIQLQASEKAIRPQRQKTQCNTNNKLGKTALGLGVRARKTSSNSAVSNGDLHTGQPRSDQGGHNMS